MVAKRSSVKRLAAAVCVATQLLFAPLAVPAAPTAAPRASVPTAQPTPSALPSLREDAVITHHHAEIGGKRIAYAATVGTIVLRDDKRQPTATMFYVAFTAEGLGPTASRPVTFAYNGGPGGSSAPIDIGGIGPRIVRTANGAATPPAPYAMIDNPNSWLDKTDLVFIDAVGTGFSRMSSSANAKDFYGVTPDSHAFVQFIRRYITRNNRWNSPKYLAGESYGTMRSVAVAKALHDEGIALNGIILIGTVLNFETIATAQPGNDLPYWLFLPSEAAVAAYYHKVPAEPTDLQGFLRNVRAFANGPYQAALSKGATLQNVERDSIAQQLYGFTGLPADYWIRANLRVSASRFRKELLGSTDRTIGRYDARFSEFDLDPASSSARGDPAADAAFSAFTASMNRYVRDELNYKTEEQYVLLSGNVNGQWDWKSSTDWGAAAANVSSDLRDVMTANPNLRVFVVCGIYDLATPFFAAEYTMDHLGLNPALQPHISFAYYPSGHMVYVNPTASAELKRDVANFFR